MTTEQCYHAQAMYDCSDIIISGPSSHIDQAINFMSAKPTATSIHILGDEAEYTSVFKLVENQLRIVHTFTAA